MIVRVILLAGLVAVVWFIFKSLIQSTTHDRCERCDGKGYWYGARGKEKCDWCNGEGKLPRSGK